MVLIMLAVDGSLVKPVHGSNRMRNRHHALILPGLFFLIVVGCGDSGTEPNDFPDRDFRQDMRDFVQRISSYASGFDVDFIVIPQNGHELLSTNGESDGPAASAYMDAISGVGREDLFYGYNDDNVTTPAGERDYMLEFMDLAVANHIEVLVTDYCWTQSYMDDSYTQSYSRGYISFAADHRDLDNIPTYPVTPWNVNTDDIATLADAANFLYLIDPSAYSTRAAFVAALAVTDFDIFILDLFHDEGQLTSGDVSSLKTRANGGTRLVIAYMSIGEAEDYRDYWQSGWGPGNPTWIQAENPNWKGNYKVRYWEPEWQSIIFGNDDSYLKKIIDAGFDGVYLDIIDAFEYFEK